MSFTEICGETLCRSSPGTLFSCYLLEGLCCSTFCFQILQRGFVGFQSEDVLGRVTLFLFFPPAWCIRVHLGSPAKLPERGRRLFIRDFGSSSRNVISSTPLHSSMLASTLWNRRPTAAASQNEPGSVLCCNTAVKFQRRETNCFHLTPLTEHYDATNPPQ